MRLKRCTQCGELKSHNDFHRNRNKHDGLQVHCKQCNRAKGQAWRAAHPERVKERNAVYSITSHGITVEQYQVMLAAQGGACADCGEVKALEIDHDHECCDRIRSCGKCVRDLVCGSCNVKRWHADRRVSA
jgi:hypothetical protein